LEAHTGADRLDPFSFCVENYAAAIALQRSSELIGDILVLALCVDATI
jgi:hypothetical protein